MSFSLSPMIKFRWEDANGNPLVGGKVYTYVAGSSTPTNTYTDATGGTANSNPVILDSRGEADIWITSDVAYKFVVKTAAGVTMDTVDNILTPSAGPTGPAGPGVPTGGLTNQYLAKLSNADFDTEWRFLESDTKVAICATDTTPSYLIDKLVDGSNVTLTTLNPGGNEQLQIDVVLPDLSGYVPYTGATTHLDMGNHDVTALTFRGRAGFTTALVSAAGQSISLESDLNTQLLNGGTTSLATTSTLIQTYRSITPSDNNLKDIGTNLARYKKIWIGDELDISHPTANATGIRMYSKAGIGNTAPKTRAYIGTNEVYDLGGSSSGTASSGYLNLSDADTAGAGASILAASLDTNGLDLVNRTIDFATSLGGGRYYVKNHEPWFADGIAPLKILRTGDVTSFSPENAGAIGEVLTKTGTGYNWQAAGGGGGTQYAAIEYSLSGVVAVAQQTKHNLGFSTVNPWYLPTGVSATVVAIGFRSRSVSAAAAGQTCKVKLYQYDPNNAVQRTIGNTTLIGSEQTVFTSSAAGTLWGGAGGVSGLSWALTDGKEYWLDISQINITADDVTFTLYVEIA